MLIIDGRGRVKAGDSFPSWVALAAQRARTGEWEKGYRRTRVARGWGRIETARAASRARFTGANTTAVSEKPKLGEQYCGWGMDVG